MAKTIGSLNVSMGLSITDFIQNLDKVKTDMGALEAVTSEASKHFDKDVAGIMGDALHKFSKTSKLGADDALAFALNLKKLGLDADGITGTLEKFGKSIGRFAKNSGEASKAFAGILGKIGQSDKVLLSDIQALESMGVKAFDALAKELTKVEGKAVTTADVMKRIASGSMSGADAFRLIAQGGTQQSQSVSQEQRAKSRLGEFLKHVETKITSAASSIYNKVINLVTNPITVISGTLASYGVYKIYDRAVMAAANTEEILTRIKGLGGEQAAQQIGGVMNTIANQGRIAQDVVGKLATGFLGLGVSSSDAARMLQSFGTISQIAGSGASDLFTKLGDISQAMIKTGEVQLSDFEALAAMGLPVYEALAQRLSMVSGKAITAEEAMRRLREKEVGTADAINALNNLQANPKVIAQMEAQANTLKGIYARLAGEIEGFFTEFGGLIVEALDLKGFSSGLIAFVQNIRANFDSLVPALKNIGMILAVVRDVLFQAFTGLVNFFTTLGGADIVAGNIDNIRAVVISFAQGVMVAMQSVMSGAITVINEIISAVGGLKKFAAIFAGVVAGAKIGGIAGGIGGGGIGALPGTILGGIGGGIYANMKVDGGGPKIDSEAIKAKMNQAFKDISESIGATGTEAAQGIVAKFINSFNNSFRGASGDGFDAKTALEKVGGDFRKFIGGLQLGVLGEEIGYSSFLKQLTGGTAAAISMFKRQMELGNITAEDFASSIEQVRVEALEALDLQLSNGLITNEEYGNSIIAIQNQFDALNPPDLAGLNAFMGGDNVPQWIKDLSKVETPLEVYRRKMEELQMALADRPDLFAAGAAQLADELEKAVGSVEALKNPGALLQGSAAAFSQVLKIQNAGNGENAADRLARIQQQALQQDRARNELLQQIGAAAANQNNLVIANF